MRELISHLIAAVLGGLIVLMFTYTPKPPEAPEPDKCTDDQALNITLESLDSCTSLVNELVENTNANVRIVNTLVDILWDAPIEAIKTMRESEKPPHLNDLSPLKYKVPALDAGVY